MIPIAGSAYTYSYATMGEFVAWIIGWDLVLEYAVGAATVAIAWSEYFNRVLGFVGMSVPYEWRHAPFESAGRRPGDHEHPRDFHPCHAVGAPDSRDARVGFRQQHHRGHEGRHRADGDRVGWGFINPANHTPFIPPPTTYTTAQGVMHTYGGMMGILGRRRRRLLRLHRVRCRVDSGAGDEEPETDMPFGILGSLAVCTILYVLFSYVLSGVATVEDFRTAGGKRRSRSRSAST